MSDIHGFYSELGVALPLSTGNRNVTIACFVNPEAHRHDDKSKSTSVSTSRGAFNCHACGAHGGAYDAALALGKSPRDAVQLLKDYGLMEDDGEGTSTQRSATKPLDSQPNVSQEQIARWHNALLASDSKLERLGELRGWSREAIERFEVGVDATYANPKGGGPIVFPSRDESGVLTGCVHYQPNPKKRADGASKSWASGPRQLFPAPESIEGDVAWIVEGESDALAAHSAGLPAVGVPGVEGWKNTWRSRFGRFRSVVVCPDADEPGQRLAERLVEALSSVVEVRRLDLGTIAGERDGFDFTDAVLEAQLNGGVEHLRDLFLKTAAHTKPSARPEPELSAPEPTGDTHPALSSAAFHGVAGRFVQMVGPQSEADPAALLVQFLAAAGNTFGRGPHLLVEGDRHPANLYVAIVGDTSGGRKGTSWGRVRQPLERADPEWKGRNVAGGLASGEGLIWNVRDPIYREKTNKKTGEPVVELEDGGVADKRLLVQESEMSRVLRGMKREGNVLSPVLRELWDTGDARSMSKNQPGKTTGAMLSVIAHTTADELRREFTEIEAANGFGNRFLWVLSRRSKLLSRGGRVDDAAMEEIAHDVRNAQRFAAVQETSLDLNSEAWELWDSRYERLTTGEPGLAGSILARGAPQVLRLALVYAVLDCSAVIRTEHVHAALAVWDYCERSVRLVFGSASGYADADRALEFIREAGGDGRTKTEIRDLFGRNKNTEPMLTFLSDRGRARSVLGDAEGGRAPEIWVATEYDRNDIDDRRGSK